MDSRHLKGELGMRLQTYAYAESCQQAMRAPRGRSFLFMLSQHFRLDLNRGSNLTQQALLDLDGFAPRDLEKFVERIEYVLNAVRATHQPTEVTKFTWLYSRVKRRKLLQRHIDRIRDSKETSVRTFLQAKAKPKPDSKAAVAQCR